MTCARCGHPNTDHTGPGGMCRHTTGRYHCICPKYRINPTTTATTTQKAETNAQ